MLDPYNAAADEPSGDAPHSPGLQGSSQGPGPAQSSVNNPPPQENMRTEYLPFTIRSIVVPADVQRAAKLRQRAYARHLPQFAARVSEPEASDADSNTVVLLAESKLDQAPLATLRIHTNGMGGLPLEQAVSMPDHLRGDILAEAVRLAVVPGHEGHLPRDAIFKAFYLACRALHVDWMVICARHPLHKRYQAMHFEDVVPSGAMVPLPYAADILHRVLYFNVNDAERLWRMRRHPLYDFVFSTFHPDIEDFTVTCRELSERIYEEKEKRRRMAALH